MWPVKILLASLAVGTLTVFVPPAFLPWRHLCRFDEGRAIYSKFILINIIIFPELISEEEWNDLDTIQFEDQFNYWNLEDPRFMARFSEQTWLKWNEDETGVLNDLRER